MSQDPSTEFWRSHRKSCKSRTQECELCSTTNTASIGTQGRSNGAPVAQESEITHAWVDRTWSGCYYKYKLPKLQDDRPRSLVHVQHGASANGEHASVPGTAAHESHETIRVCTHGKRRPTRQRRCHIRSRTRRRRKLSCRRTDFGGSSVQSTLCQS